MDDRQKTKRRLFNIFEKDNSLNEIPPSDSETPKFNLKLTARRRSTRLKSEIFVERIPPDSPENDPYAFTQNDFEDTKLVYTSPKKKAKMSKSPSSMERIDRYFNIQPSKASNTLSTNSCRIALETTEEVHEKIDQTVYSKATNSPKLKEEDDLQEYGDSFIDSIDTNAIVDMLKNTEIVEGQSQVKNENSKMNTPKKYDMKSNENPKPFSSKENNNLPKSNISKKNQNVAENPVDSIHTNALIDVVNNSEIGEKKSQVPNKISNCNTTPKKQNTLKKRDTKKMANLETIVSLKTTDSKVSYKENKSLLNTKTMSKTTKKNQNNEDCSQSLQSLRTRGRKAKVSAFQPENDVSVSSKNKNQKKLQESLITETSSSLIYSPENSVENKISVSLCKNERRQTISSIHMNNNVTKANSSQQLSVSLTSSSQKTIENEKSVSAGKRGRRPTISSIKMDNNVAELAETNDSYQFSPTALTSSPQKSVENRRSVSLKKRVRRQTICGIQMDYNVAEVTETNDSCQFPATPLISSPQKSVENEKSVPLRKRGRRPTISGIKMDNNVAEVAEPIDSRQLPSTCFTSSQQKTVENVRSLSLRKRGRRQTISGIQIDNNVAEVTETNDTSQLPSASPTTSPQKSVENEKSVPLRKRGRRPTICGIKMGNNVAEEAETNDSSQLPSSSLTSSPQKTVENETSVPLRKIGRRQTICSKQMDNNFPEVAETNDTSQLPSASLTSSPQKTVENETPVPLRKRGRRPTICGIKMGNNVAEEAETNDSSQLPSASPTSSPQKSVENEKSVPLRKRGRRPTICGIKMGNNVAEEAETNDSSQLPSSSLTSSPQKTVENETSVPLRKRGRRQTICSKQMDNNFPEVAETNDTSQLPSASLTSSPQKTVENETSVPLRKRGRRPTISGIKMDNNVAEVTETNDTSQLPSASLTSSPQKTVESETPVPLRKRGRRPTICGIKMDNNVAEVTETNDSSQLPSSSLTSSPQKPVENEASVPLRKRGRRQTICGKQMDNNVAEVIETNDTSQLPSASLTSSPQKTVESETPVPLRKRGGRQTICGIQMDNNVTEVTETNDSSQLPRKRGRRPTICQTKLENYFTSEVNKTVESTLENQTQNTHSLSGNHKEKLPTGSQQARNQSRKPQKITNTDPNDNKVVEEPKRKRGRPPKSPNFGAEKQVKMRIQKINVAKKPKNTYGRLSKDKLNSVSVRRIPKERLDEVLDMLQNEDHEIWKERNISCNAGIHRYWEARTMTSDQNMKMKYARQFLLRRDWLNLSKILCLSNQDAKNNMYYPLLVKYATLCLAHTDKEQFHKFVNSLITMADSSAILKKCTKISRENEE